jgi:hypothetical protein
MLAMLAGVATPAIDTETEAAVVVPPKLRTDEVRAPHCLPDPQAPTHFWPLSVICVPPGVPTTVGLMELICAAQGHCRRPRGHGPAPGDTHHRRAVREQKRRRARERVLVGDRDLEACGADRVGKGQGRGGSCAAACARCPLPVEGIRHTIWEFDHEAPEPCEHCHAPLSAASASPAGAWYEQRRSARTHRGAVRRVGRGDQVDGGLARGEGTEVRACGRPGRGTHSG